MTRIVLVAAMLGFACRCAESEIKVGAPFQAGNYMATLTKLDALPYIENEYSKRFRFDTADNPKLKELRERYKLDEVVASGKSEFEKQALLLDWAHRQFKKFGHPSTKSKGALDVLKDVENGGAFFCTQFGEVMVSSAASLGWVDRALALRRHKGVNKNGGSTEHTSTEIWSNQFGKWVMFDPTSNFYVEKSGIPQSAYEIRQEWFYHDGKDLVFVMGPERKKYTKAELPVFVGTYEGFGKLTLDPDELDKYGFTGYIPNTDLMSSGPDYGKMFIVKDQVCEGTKWHERAVPQHPETEANFPIDQAALTLASEGEKIVVGVKTMTPNFKEFNARMDGGDWKSVTERIEWPIHPGLNRLEVKAMNRFGVEGPVSIVEVKAAAR